MAPIKLSDKIIPGTS